jgi:methionine aminopeptidase
MKRPGTPSRRPGLMLGSVMFVIIFMSLSPPLFIFVSQLGALIQETIESYEMEGSPDVSLNAIKKIPSDTITSGSKNVKPLRPVRNLSGHTVIDYVVHGGKSVPLIKAEKNPQKMEEGCARAVLCMFFF